MKKLVFILIMVITMSFTVNTALSIDLDSNESISTDNQVKISAETISENHKIKESFYKIADLEYDEKKCNCKYKSEAFADLLVKNGANNVYLVTIEHESCKYSHMVVSWDGKVYDATVKPSVYGISEDKYFDEIKKYGFNGLMFKVLFVANNKN